MFPYWSFVGAHFYDFEEACYTSWELSLGMQLLDVGQNLMEVRLKPGIMGRLSKRGILWEKKVYNIRPGNKQNLM